MISAGFRLQGDKRVRGSVVPWLVARGAAEAHSLHGKICVSPGARAAPGASAEGDGFVRQCRFHRGPRDGGDAQGTAPTRSAGSALLPLPTAAPTPASPPAPQPPPRWDTLLCRGQPGSGRGDTGIPVLGGHHWRGVPAQQWPEKTHMVPHCQTNFTLRAVEWHPFHTEAPSHWLNISISIHSILAGSALRTLPWL